MLLVKIDGKKHYENLEFEEEQVIQSLCFFFILIFPLSCSSYYLSNWTISAMMTCPVDKIQSFLLVRCLRYLPSSCSKARYFYISTEIMQVFSLIHIYQLFSRLERFSLDCRKGLVLVLVLVLLRPLVGQCIYFGFGFTTVK